MPIDQCLGASALPLGVVMARVATLRIATWHKSVDNMYQQEKKYN